MIHKQLELTHFCNKEKNTIVDIKNIEDYNYNYNSTKKNKFNEKYNYIKERFLSTIRINKIIFLFKIIKSVINHSCPSFIQFKNFIITKKRLIEILNKSLSISIHILIMIIFEIYFFFDYVVNIENKTFIKKIGDTFKHFEIPTLNTIEVEILKKIIDNEDYILNDLYIQYINSKKNKNIILHNLFVKSCKMTIPVSVICLILSIASCFSIRDIKWKSVIFENIIMFLVLGIFEYYFFLNIILKYEPVTNEEIKYFMMNNTFMYLSRIESINDK